MKPDFYYEIALSSLPHIGAKTIQHLLDHFDSAEEILKANTKAFENIPKITHIIDHFQCRHVIIIPTIIAELVCSYSFVKMRHRKTHKKSKKPKGTNT